MIILTFLKDIFPSRFEYEADIRQRVPYLYLFIFYPPPTHEVICTIQLHPVQVRFKLSIMSHKLKCDVNQAQNSNKIRY